MQEIPTLLGFTAGELSPWLSSRYDLQAYQRGAALLKNLITMPYGGVRRRRGTTYIGTISAPGERAIRLFPFVFSTTDALMLVFVPGLMYIYKGRKKQNYRMVTPWQTAAEVESLRFTQVNDTVYCTGEKIRPVCLYRLSETSWQYRYVAFSPYPRETYARQEGRLEVVMSAAGETVHLRLPQESTRARFTADMAGREYIVADAEVPPCTLFEGMPFQAPVNPVVCPDLSVASVAKGAVLYEADASSGMRKYFTCIRDYRASDYSGCSSPDDYPHYFLPGVMWLHPETQTPYEVCADWTLRTDGQWDASWELWRSYDTTEEEPDFRLWQWSCVKSFSQSPHAARENWALSGAEERPCRMVLVCRRAASLPQSPFLSFSIGKGQREYLFRVTETEDARNAKAQNMTPYLGHPLCFSSFSWSFGAIGVRNGYPRFSSFFQGRIWYGGMAGLPTTLLASATDDFDNFRVGSGDDDALHLTLAADNQSCICWVFPTRQMLLGTADSEWVLGSGEGVVVTPSTAAFRRQSSAGSEMVPPVAVENTVLFVQRGGRRLREISYKLEADGYTATDAGLMAEHLLRAGVQELCVLHASDSYVWALMKDGSVAVLTLNTEQQVMAWQRMEFPQRRVLHLASLPDTEGRDDELWLVMYNETGGVYTLECITEMSSFLDGGIEVTAAPSAETVLLPYLKGLTVQYTAADGSDPQLHTARVSEQGELTFPAVQTPVRYSVGIAYDSELCTLPMESMNSFNSVRQLSRVRVRLSESDPHFLYKSTVSTRWESYSGDAVLAPAPYTGSLRLVQMPQADVGQGFSLLYNGAGDFRLLSLTVEADYHGK